MLGFACRVSKSSLCPPPRRQPPLRPLLPTSRLVDRLTLSSLPSSARLRRSLSASLDGAAQSVAARPSLSASSGGVAACDVWPGPSLSDSLGGAAARDWRRPDHSLRAAGTAARPSFSASSGGADGARWHGGADGAQIHGGEGAKTRILFVST
jgi:hypothetical protein